MPSENTYSAFRCNDNIVVMHQQEHHTAQTLIIFRESQRLATHEKKLIGFYAYSNEAITLFDDPLHDAGAILTAIAKQMRKRSLIALKYLASAVAGVLLVSAAWYLSPPEKVYIDVSASGAIATAVSPTSPRTTATSETFSRAAATESQNMQKAMQDNRSALPASPSAALQPSRQTLPPSRAAHRRPSVKLTPVSRWRKCSSAMLTAACSPSHCPPVMNALFMPFSIRPAPSADPWSRPSNAWRRNTT
ncbi:hypothetical protein E05_51800 (plasmid) [Plautia stali symbiont]|nr:hypothetical protein E05_51800 [Plautia stali symbiont]